MAPIQSKLTAEEQKLLKEYDAEWIMPINRQDEVIYSQALMRGIVLEKFDSLNGEV